MANATSDMNADNSTQANRPRQTGLTRPVSFHDIPFHNNKRIRVSEEPICGTCYQQGCMGGDKCLSSELD